MKTKAKKPRIQFMTREEVDAAEAASRAAGEGISIEEMRAGLDPKVVAQLEADDAFMRGVTSAMELAESALRSAEERRVSATRSSSDTITAVEGAATSDGVGTESTSGDAQLGGVDGGGLHEPLPAPGLRPRRTARRRDGAGTPANGVQPARPVPPRAVGGHAARLGRGRGAATRAA